MRYLSLCSGIEAATVAWHPLGWEAVAFSEIEAFPCAVLAHHWPAVPNLGDMNGYKEWDIGAVDLSVGGTPCQSFSVAGLRRGLDDPRGNLMLVYLAIARRFAPRWVVWENVPGVLSSHRGRDFGTFLGGLAECGYGFAYRVLDAQFFGVPQRRRRVFVVGYLGDWRVAAAVLFERESLRGHPAPSREAGERVAPTVGEGSPFSHTGNQRAESDALVAAPLPFDTTQITSKGNYSVPKSGDPCHPLAKGQHPPAIAGSLQASGKAAGSATQQDAETGMLIAYALRADGFDASEDGTGRGTPLVAFQSKQSATSRAPSFDDVSPLIDVAKAGGMAVSGPLRGVRRLTPRECERLQGFPDDYTAIPYGKRGKPAKDGPRYRALGNSMAVPVMRWIGERIQRLEAA